jgi:hypothetical protein
MPYTLIRRYGDEREERYDWAHEHNIRVVGDVWQVEGDDLMWRVTKVTAGDATRPAAIVLEPVGE